MAEAATQAPHRADRIDELEFMLATARGVVSGDDGVADVEKLLTSIEQHERREASIITEDWYEELGGGD